jgi:hypothetical protein
MTDDRAFAWLRGAVVGVFVVTLAAGIFLPIYTDEVGWRLQERAALDGVDKLFNDLCGPSSLAKPPFFMMPVRYYSAFFNTSFADPFFVRLSGIGYALVWLALLLTLIRRVVADATDRKVLSIIGVGLMCMGVLPLLLVWSRPEQPILLAATAALVLACGGAQRPCCPTGIAWLRSVGVVCLAAIAFSYHLKALFLAPLFLTCLVFTSRGRHAVVPRLVLGTVLIGLAGWAGSYWIDRLACPDDPIMHAAYASNNMGFAVTGSRSPGELAAAIGKIVGNMSVVQYFALATPHSDPMSNWLEPDQLSEANSYMWLRSLVLLWSGVSVLALVCFFMGARDAWRVRRLDARPVLALLLLATVLAWSATQAIRNPYEASLVLPLIMMAILLALSTQGRNERIGAWAKVLGVLVAGAALFSPLAIAVTFGPSLARATAQKGYIAMQPYSVPVFGYASQTPDIIATARKCGIDDPAKARGLLLDDFTYFAFMRSRLPQHQLGVLTVWRGSITDPMAYLRSRGSDGAILGCHLLPEELRSRARSKGRFCCLLPSDG